MQNMLKQVVRILTAMLERVNTYYNYYRVVTSYLRNVSQPQRLISLEKYEYIYFVTMNVNKNYYIE
jgi:hypothetical protein